MKILKIIYYLFIACIAAIALLLVFSIFPIPGNYKILIVQSGSMAPAIKMGSVVVVKPSADYKIGEVITFGQVTKTKAPTTHRIFDIKVENDEPVYITKGDANNAPDSKEVQKSEIIGKVLFDVPYAGYAVAAARKPLGFALIIVVPAAIIIFDEIRKIINEAKKIREKRKSENKETAEAPKEE